MILSAPEGTFPPFADEGIIKGALVLADLGLVHSDLRFPNIHLYDGHVKLCDLCATVRKNDTLVAPLLPRFSRPVGGDDANMVADEQSEIFAIGICIYALVMEHLPYPTMTEGEVATLFEVKEFPPTNNEPFEPFKAYGCLGAIVQGCWIGSYGAIRALDTEVGLFTIGLGYLRK
ncbi:hypothetical protein B7494_g6765 [Chlorociboria aeruginascens]|nr:hypothetical protein B7494_g6765 [Chlorociboria aeruginascens]